MPITPTKIEELEELDKKLIGTCNEICGQEEKFLQPFFENTYFPKDLYDIIISYTKCSYRYFPVVFYSDYAMSLASQPTDEIYHVIDSLQNGSFYKNNGYSTWAEARDNRTLGEHKTSYCIKAEILTYSNLAPSKLSVISYLTFHPPCHHFNNYAFEFSTPIETHINAPRTLIPQITISGTLFQKRLIFLEQIEEKKSTAEVPKSLSSENKTTPSIKKSACVLL